MKRALPLFLLFAVLGAVALVLIQPSGDAELETPIAMGVTPSSATEALGALQTFEDPLAPAASSEREAAPGIGEMTPAGDLRGSGTTLKGQLVTPVGSCTFSVHAGSIKLRLNLIRLKLLRFGNTVYYYLSIVIIDINTCKIIGCTIPRAQAE